MKVIFLLFDSLNRRALPPYGGTVYAPNFERLAGRTTTFDTSYVCSMPCMPARRDMLTGRPNFLHRGWGPMDPYDDCLPALLQHSGIYTHLISDHLHYWEEGGTNYHTKYNTWENVRGHEGDPWIPQVARPELPGCVAGRNDRYGVQDFINRQAMPEPHLQPMSQVFSKAADFLERNRNDDNWFLQVETFDPHEPFFTHRRYKDLNAAHYRDYKGLPFDWPPYRKVQESPEEIDHLRHEYAALVSMCDEKLGDLLDHMDRLDLWKDTMLIVGTDHGFLLGEHDCWAKCWMPFYEEVARTPFFVWDPRSAAAAGRRRGALVQPAIDLAPTVLGFFGQSPAKSMTGHDLAATIAEDRPVREHGIFGMHGTHVNITDGRYVYMRGNPPGKKNEPLFEYTLMPAKMREAFSTGFFQQPLESARFDFTKGCYVMKISTPHANWAGSRFETLLFDLSDDPHQERPIQNPAIEKYFVNALDNHMRALDAPAEQWERLGMEAFR